MNTDGKRRTVPTLAFPRGAFFFDAVYCALEIFAPSLPHFLNFMTHGVTFSTVSQRSSSAQRTSDIFKILTEK